MPQGIQHRVILVGVMAARGVLDAALAERGSRVAAECADIAVAISAARGRPEDAHLFVLTDADPGRVAALGDAVPGQPIVALMPPSSGLPLAFGLQRAGAAQVVPQPIAADDVGKALDCVAMQYAPAVREARVIVVCGVSGGAGATTLTLELARELAARHATPGRPGCLMVEFTGRLGALATMLNVEPPITSHDLLDDPGRLTPQGVRQSLTLAGPGLHVLVAPYREIAPSPPSAASVTQLVELARGLASVVLLDLPGTFDDVMFESFARADHVVLVGVQTVASIRAMKLIRDVMVREEGLRPPALVINRYNPGVAGFEAARLGEVLGDPRLLTVAADFPSLMAAAKDARPLRDAAPLSPILPDVRRLSARVGGVRPSSDSAERLQRARAGPRAVRVLHIEDDPVQHYVVRMHLTRQIGYTFDIVTALNEEDGVGRFKAEKFDLVILDYHLTQGNGLGTLRRLRAEDAMVPILVVSGLTETHVAAELLEAGADDFLSKENLAGERLGQALARVMARSEALRARQAAPEGEAPPSADVTELLRLLDEVRRSARGSSFGAARVQRLADLVGDELDRDGKTPFPRKALLALFLRLFAGEQPPG